MQGKSCFNFNAVDEPLFAELEQIAGKAFATFKQKMALLKAKTSGPDDVDARRHTIKVSLPNR